MLVAVAYTEAVDELAVYTVELPLTDVLHGQDVVVLVPQALVAVYTVAAVHYIVVAVVGVGVVHPFLIDLMYQVPTSWPEQSCLHLLYLQNLIHKPVSDLSIDGMLE